MRAFKKIKPEAVFRMDDGSGPDYPSLIRQKLGQLERHKRRCVECTPPPVWMRTFHEMCPFGRELARQAEEYRQAARDCNPIV